MRIFICSNYISSFGSFSNILKNSLILNLCVHWLIVGLFCFWIVLFHPSKLLAKLFLFFHATLSLFSQLSFKLLFFVFDKSKFLLRFKIQLLEIFQLFLEICPFLFKTIPWMFYFILKNNLLSLSTYFVIYLFSNLIQLVDERIIFLS